MYVRDRCISWCMYCMFWWRFWWKIWWKGCMFPEIGCVFCGRSGMNGARTASISVREPTRSTNRRLSRILTTIGCVRFGKIQTPRYAETGRISLGTTTKLTVRNHIIQAGQARRPSWRYAIIHADLKQSHKRFNSLRMILRFHSKWSSWGYWIQNAPELVSICRSSCVFGPLATEMGTFRRCSPTQASSVTGEPVHAGEQQLTVRIRT
jgi:hypothetical protein